MPRPPVDAARRSLLAAGAAGAAGAAVMAGSGAWPVSAASPMARKPIPGSGESLPVIGIGTWQSFDVGAEAMPNLAAILGAFAEGGGTVIDSSPMYGRSESVAGELIQRANLRRKLFVATKVWTTGREAGIAQMNDSLKKLRADPIDLMQVHNLQDLDTHLATLSDWKKAGRVRYVGITHYTAGAYASVERALEKHAVDFLQINYSIGEREAEKRLLPMARERKIAVIANRPFAGGDLFRRLRSTPLPAWAAEIDCVSWAQLMLKFVVAHPAVTCAIPATSRIEHLRDNLGGGMGRMPDEAMRGRIAGVV
ncbi:MAG: aldo/keto reductase [Betaproteobacteria bacterium]|nr:aldo/keto reductase [Betaproteobacteria bacterium]